MYIPILKNRTIEMKSLKCLSKIPLSNKTIPLIEIIQERLQSNSKNTFIDILPEIINSNNLIMVDFLRTTLPKSINTDIKQFINNISRNHTLYIDSILKLNKFSNIIPVLSYREGYTDDKLIKQDVEKIRENFTSISFRISANCFKEVFNDIAEVITEKDYLLFDIDTASHYNPVFKVQYSLIDELKKAKHFKSFIINSPKDKELYNIHLKDGEPIFEIDNSLRDTYQDVNHFNFDGFGDYAGVTNTFPSSGGSISPAGIYYSSKHNYFIGYRRNRTLSEFEEYIAPAIYSSDYWKEFTAEHHNTCIACKEILRIVNEKDINLKKAKSQGKWKGITMQHYIYSIDEWLNS